MVLRRFRFLVVVALVVLAMPVLAAPIDVTLDTRDLPRKLLHSTIEMPVSPGPFVFWYPEWIPGIHAPRGPIQNLAGLTVTTDQGADVPWTRDPLRRFRFECTIPEGTASITVALDYITNQPSTNSKGVDSYGNSLLGAVNWNTVLVYPDGAVDRDLEYRAEIVAPDGWSAKTSLPLTEEGDGRYRYEAVSLTALMDSPVLLGAHTRSIALESGDGPPVTLHLGSEAPRALQLEDDLIEKYGRMVREAYLLFGKAHYEHYHFLVACSNDFPYTGLEHLRSSYNSVGERDLLSKDKLNSWVGYLLPHEFVHSWCGKYRRPAGMVRENFHTPKDTRLLWVYEGLTQYLGHVLTVRSGIWDLEHYREVLGGNIGNYMRQAGRQWRTLEDTAADSYHLRGGSRAWSKLRRGQDYYNEGLLFWLEVDALIREKTDNKRSLDDFVAAFLGKSGDDSEMLGFDEGDITAALDGVVEYDWEGLIAARIKETQAALPLDLLDRIGYRIEYRNEATDYQAKREKDGGYASAYHAIGMSVSSSGVVHGSVAPGMAADAAGIAPGMKVMGVNGKKFTLDRFRDALKDSTATRAVELLILDGDVYRTIVVPYDGGARYLHLQRDESKPDRLADIMAAREKT